MSDEDSWSSSSSESESSSSDSSSGGGWAEAASEAAGQFVGSLFEPSTVVSSSPPGSSSSAEAPLLNPAIMALFQAGQGRAAVDPRPLARRIFEQPRWLILAGSGGEMVVEVIRGTDDRLRQAFSSPLTHGKKRRGWEPPAGGTLRVLRLWTTDPGRACRPISGYELARGLPAQLDGLLLMHGDEPGIGLGRADVPLLTQLADAHDLDTALEQPAPGQLATLLNGRWYIQRSKKRFELVTWGFEHLIRVCTHPDGAYEDGPPAQEMDGRTLFAQLAADEAADGVAVARGMAGDFSRENLYLGPGILRGLASGVDRRIGATPLPARTRAEIELWMEISGFPWRDREIVPVPQTMDPAQTTLPAGANAPAGASSSTLVQVRSSLDSTWRPYETGAGATSRPGPTLGPVFTVAQPDAPPGYLGDGQTEILCGGLLAEYLYDKGIWHPPTWFISRKTRLAAARFAMIAAELLKLIPDGADELPRSAILTVAGASFLRRRPEYGARRRIQEVFDRYHRAATHWVPSFH